MQIEVTSVFNFAKFVKWPEPGPNSANTTTFCAWGSDGLYAVLGRNLVGSTISTRAVTANRIEISRNPESCHVVFFGRQRQEARERVAGRGSPNRLADRGRF